MASNPPGSSRIRCPPVQGPSRIPSRTRQPGRIPSATQAGRTAQVPSASRIAQPSRLVQPSTSRIAQPSTSRIAQPSRIGQPPSGIAQPSRIGQPSRVGRVPSRVAQPSRIGQPSRAAQPPRTVVAQTCRPVQVRRIVAPSRIAQPSRIGQPSRVPSAYRVHSRTVVSREVVEEPVQPAPVRVSPVQAVPVRVSPVQAVPVQVEAAVICPPITPEDEKWTKYEDREFTPPAEEIDPYTIFCPLFTPPGSPVFRLQQVLPPPEWSPQPQDVDPEALFGQFVLPEAGVSLLGEGVQLGAPPSELGPIRPFPFPLRAPSPTPVLPPAWRPSQRDPSRSPTRTSSPPPCPAPEDSLTLGWKRLPPQRDPSRSPRYSSPPPCPAPEDSLTLGWKRLPPQRDPSRSPTRYSSPPPCPAPEDSLTLGWKRLPPRRDPSRSPTRYSSPPPCPAPEDSLTLGWKRLPPQRDPSRSPTRTSSPPPCPAPEDSLTLGWKRLPPQRDPSRSPMRTPSPSPYATPEQSQRRARGVCPPPTPESFNLSRLFAEVDSIPATPVARRSPARGVYPPSPESYDMSRLFYETSPVGTTPVAPYYATPRPDRRTDPVAFFRQHVPTTPSFGQEGPVAVPSPYVHDTSEVDPELLKSIFHIPRPERTRRVCPASPESYHLSRLFCQTPPQTPVSYSAPSLPYSDATPRRRPTEPVMLRPVAVQGSPEFWWDEAGARFSPSVPRTHMHPRAPPAVSPGSPVIADVSGLEWDPLGTSLIQCVPRGVVPTQPVPLVSPWVPENVGLEWLPDLSHVTSPMSPTAVDLSSVAGTPESYAIRRMIGEVPYMESPGIAAFLSPETPGIIRAQSTPVFQQATLSPHITATAGDVTSPPVRRRLWSPAPATSPTSPPFLPTGSPCPPDTSGSEAASALGTPAAEALIASILGSRSRSPVPDEPFSDFSYEQSPQTSRRQPDSYYSIPSFGFEVIPASLYQRVDESYQPVDESFHLQTLFDSGISEDYSQYLPSEFETETSGDESYHLQRLFDSGIYQLPDAQHAEQVPSPLKDESYHLRRLFRDPIVNIFEKFRIQYVRDQLSKPPDYTPGSHIVDFPETEEDVLLSEVIKPYKDPSEYARKELLLPEPSFTVHEIPREFSFAIDEMDVHELIRKVKQYKDDIEHYNRRTDKYRAQVKELKKINTAVVNKHRQIEASIEEAWERFPQTLSMKSPEAFVRMQGLQTKVDKLSDECEALRNSVEDESKQVKTLTNTICQLTRDKALFGDEEVSEQEKQEIIKSIENDSYDVGELAHLLTLQDQMLADALQEYEADTVLRKKYEAFLQRADIAKKALLQKLDDFKEVTEIQHNMKRLLQEKLAAFDRGEYSPPPQLSPQPGPSGVRAEKGDPAEIQLLSAQREVLATTLQDIKGESTQLRKNLAKQRQMNKNLRRKLDYSQNK